jgi:hypothetical protein
MSASAAVSAPPGAEKESDVNVVVDTPTREHIDRNGGAVYVWPKLTSCCRVRTFVLQCDTKPPERAVELVHAASGFQVYATPGLIAPDELHFELDGDHVRAYWNGQGWIG